MFELCPLIHVYYYEGADEFTSPFWSLFDYPSSVLTGSAAFMDWLVSKGLPSVSDPNSDANGDGVTLLMAYALNLDPNQNHNGSLPQPVFTANTMTLSFYAGNPDIIYTVQTCTNLSDWTTEGVSTTPPDSITKISTATVNRTGPCRYIRLLVKN
ncbi:MAG: hypothetical protein H8M99_07760 [Gloeobacteraceae cyanobacterium ES-bin-144]|nr:hypothetical protein [Verrucomicrobiales bacterium]